MNWRLLLLPFSAVYSAIAGLRNLFFNIGIRKQKKYELPVVLVGNLSVGGTGKTPHIEYLLKMLSQKFKVATISRGYGRKTKGFVLAGKGVDASVIGDEPMQYYLKYKNITVSVCENRVEGIDKLLAMNPGPQIILMDDGYQHRKVKPDFSILLTTFNKPFVNDYVLPAGDLRETSAGYKRADCIIITKIPDNLPEIDKQNLIIEINPMPHQKVFFSSMEYGNPSSFFLNQQIQLNELIKHNIILFTGIATSEYLVNYLSQNSRSLISLSFPDHHEFNEKDVRNIISKYSISSGEKKIILTTEKDFLRLHGTSLIEQFKSLPCYYIPVTVKIDKEKEFENLILDTIKKYQHN